MARKKVTVRYIANNPTRKETGKKRTMGLIKKAGELSTLCDIDVLLVVVPEGEPSQPVAVYPPRRPETMRIVDRFKSMPELDRSKKHMNGEGCVRERIGKAQDQLRKAERDNRRRKTTLLIHDVMVGLRRSLEGLAVDQLISVGWTAENLVKKIKDCVAYRSGQQASVMADDPLPRAATGKEVEVWQCSDSRSYGSVGAGGVVLQLGNVEAGSAWAFPGTYFPPV